MGTNKNIQTIKVCGLLRRLAAIFYDLILLSAVLFFGTLIMMPFTQGQAISSGNIPYNIYIFCISYLYFIWHWTHGGQTLGMLAWKVKLEQINAEEVSVKNATIRFLLAIISLIFIGVGFVWSFFDSENLTFHDRYSGTYLVIIAG